MNVGFLATRIQAEVMRRHDALASAYQRLPDAHQFWGMVDLAQSSNFRLSRGPREGYIRGETFLTLVAEVVSPTPEVHIIKELGDGVLLMAASFRPVLETLILINQVAVQLDSVTGSKQYPFRVRCGIDYGAAKRLVRPQEDYLGRSIDRLARLMAVRDEQTAFLISEEAFSAAPEILEEYSNIVSFGSPKTLSQHEGKGLLHPVIYRTLIIDGPALAGFEMYFQAWKTVPHPGKEDSAGS